MNNTRIQNDAGPLERYGTGPIHFAGSDSGMYERHLLFDNVVATQRTDARDRFEAFARSCRDVLSQRWTLTEETYTLKGTKRIDYLSMEFLIGRSLPNNVTNLLLSGVVDEIIRQRNLDWIALLEQEPDAALGNGGLGRLAACFLESMATLRLPAMGYGLRYEYGIFRQTIEDGWQREKPDNWLRHPDPWEVARPQEAVEVRMNCSFDLRGGILRAVPGRPSTLIRMPFDRPVVGYGGWNINTLGCGALAQLVTAGYLFLKSLRQPNEPVRLHPPIKLRHDHGRCRARQPCSKSMTAALISVKLDGSASLIPAIDEGKSLAAKCGIVHRKRCEHRRRICRYREPVLRPIERRHRDRIHRPIDIAEEIWPLSRCCSEHCRHGRHCASRKADHSDVSRIDRPFGRICPN